MSKTLVLKPRLTEKAYAQSEVLNTYLFEVPAAVNRHAVANAVKLQYKVTVTGVRMANKPAKPRRTYRRRGRVTHHGRTAGFRKAYVTLKEGDKLPIYAAVGEEKADDQPRGAKGDKS